MSWDVLIMKTDGKTPVRELPNDFKPECMGNAEELRGRLSQFFATLDWSDPACGIFVGHGFSLEFNFTRSGPVDSFMLHVRGGGGAVMPIVDMCKHFGWQALDCQCSEFMDLTNPDPGSWERWQTFRDKVVSQYRENQDFNALPPDGR